MPKNLRFRIDAAGATDDHAKVVLGEAVRPAQTTETRGTGSHRGVAEFDGTRTGHDGIGGGAQFVEMIVIALAAEGRNGAIGRGDLAIGSHRHVHEDEGTRRFPFHSINIASP